MTVATLKARIAAAEKALDDRPPMSWEKVGHEHAAHVMALEAQHRAAKEAATATARARSAALSKLLTHEETILDVSLDDIAEWADTGRRLSAIVEALTERGKKQSAIVDHAQRRLQNARAENPAAAARVNYIKHLKDVLMDDTSSETDKRKAWAELNELFEADRIKVIEYMPPGFDPNRYDKHGNFKQ